MRPPELRRLTKDDVDLSTSDGVDRLFSAFNYFAEQTQLLLSGRASIGDNVQGQVSTVTFTTAADYVASKTFTPINIAWTKGVNASAVLVGQVLKANNQQDVIKEPVTLAWYQASATQVRINFVTGLADSTKYQLTVVIF